MIFKKTHTHTHTHTHTCIRVHARKHTNIRVYTCLCKLVESTIRQDLTHINKYIYAKNTNEKLDTHAQTRMSTLTSSYMITSTIHMRAHTKKPNSVWFPLSIFHRLSLSPTHSLPRAHIHAHKYTHTYTRTKSHETQNTESKGWFKNHAFML